MVRAASRGRATITAEDTWPVEPVQLSEGSEEPALVCFPSLVMTSGAQEFARFAARLRGRRQVHALPAPGFLTEEGLPADLDVFVHGQAEAALRAANGAPVVLVGRSSGGWAAHAVAEELHRRGHTPSGLVLLDTPLPSEPGVLPLVTAALPIVTESVMERAGEFELLDTARLTAMGGYLGLFSRWGPGHLPVPVTQVCPWEPVRTPSGAVLETGWKWPGRHDRVEVPGDHLTMLEDHAETTAETVEGIVTRLDRSCGHRD